MHEPDYLKNFEHLEYDAKVQEAEVCREDAIGFKPGSVLLRLQEITSEKNLQDLRTLIEEASKEGITPQMIAAEIERELKTELESGVIHNAKSSLREAQEAGLTISFVPETYTSQAQKQLDDLIVSRDGNPSGALYYIRDAEELGIKITIRDESIPMIEKYVEKLLVDQHVNPDKPYELLQEMKPYVSADSVS